MANVKLLIDIEGNSARLVSEAEKANRALRGISDSAGSMRSSLNLIKYDAIVNLGEKAYQTGQQLFAMAESGAKVVAIQDSFELMARNSGVAIDSLVSKLKEATNDTIDDSDLMLKATRLITEGFSSNQIVQLGEAARVAARLMGTDVSQAYEQIADSIVNLRQRGLKTAGFVIDLNEAYEKQAGKLGVTKEQLNDYGKQMALMNAVAEKTIELQNKLGVSVETASERIQKQKSAWKEFGENLAKAALDAWNLVTALAQAGKSKIGTIDWSKQTADMTAKTSGVNEYDLYGGTPLGPGVTQPERNQITQDALAKANNKILEEESKAWGHYADQQIEELTRLNEVQNALLKEEVDRREYAKDKIIEGDREMQRIKTEANTAVIHSNMEVYISDQRRQENLISLNKEYASLTGSTQLQIEADKAELALMIQRFDTEDEGMKKEIEAMRRNAAAREELMVNGFKRYAVEVGDATKQISDAQYSLASGMASSFSTFFQSIFDNTKSWKDKMTGLFQGLANSFIKALSDMAAKALVTNLSGGSSGGGLNFGSLLSGLFGSGGSGSAAAGVANTSGILGNAAYVPYFAEGGIVNTPTLGMIGEHGSEAVIPLDRLEKGGGATTVIVNNYSSNSKTETRESQDGRGNRSIEVMISDLVGKEINRTGSAPNRAVKQMGGSDSLIRR